MIKEFTGWNAFLSNFFPCSVEDTKYRIVFSSSEHTFQSRKTNIMSEKLAIRDCETPGKAKRLGRSVTLREDWEDVKVQMMLDTIKAKFDQNEHLKKLLIETENIKLIEGNYWHDNFWGVCYCSDCNGNGKNTLGILLENLRQEYITERK